MAAGNFYPQPPVFIGGRQPYAPRLGIPVSYVPDNPPRFAPIDPATRRLIRESWEPLPPPPWQRRPTVTASYVSDNPPLRGPLGLAQSFLLRQTWEPGPPPIQRRPTVTASYVSDNPPFRGDLDKQSQIAINVAWLPAPPLPQRYFKGFTPSGGDQPVRGALDPETYAVLRRSWEPGPPQPQRLGDFYTPSGGDQPIRQLDPAIRALLRLAWEPGPPLPTLRFDGVTPSGGDIPVYAYPLTAKRSDLWQPPWQRPPVAPQTPQEAPAATQSTYPFVQSPTYQIIMASWIGQAYGIPHFQGFTPDGLPDVVVTPPAPVVPDVGGLGKRHRRRWMRLRIGDEEFDIFDEAEANRLLEQLRESAQQTAEAAANKAVAKAIVAKTPAAKERALVPKPPRIVVEFSYADEASRLMRARVEAAQALIESTYRRMLVEAYLRAVEADEDETITMLLLS